MGNLLEGNDGANRLDGAGGADTLLGGLGADTLRGGAGNDYYAAVEAADVIEELAGGGNDTVETGAFDLVLGANVEAGVLTGTLNLRLDGNALDNALTGNAGANVIYGYDGADTIFSFGGDDTLYGGSGNDRMGGGDGADAVYGADGSDTLYGGTGADTMYGGAGADELYGGDGDDGLYGANGADLLFGGLGADVFQFNDLAVVDGPAVADRIVDFTRADGDVIDLAPIDADGAAWNGDSAFDFIGTAAFSSTKRELRYEIGTEDTTVLADLDGDGAADLTITLTGLHALTAGDFDL
ncbi:hypothetical protein KB874_11205 [Aestuariicoccus sp. KMU-90]|uniref:Peptidase M10 serralysin C-terminal domain-containing protein n=1 Tax=Thetidibacter halocola TaxID=2827239 RepID=A0A8J7WBW5_9RHOB|nr:hypothetical protein [Thetidibacter halocola]